MSVPYEEPMSAARRQNMQLLMDPSEDDGFVRAQPRQFEPAPQLLPRRNAAPLIEEEPEPSSGSGLSDSGKANLARQAYDRNMAAKKPWKRGMPFSQSTLDMFDPSTAYEKTMFGGIRNPRQAANYQANRAGGFQKLFGAKMSDDEIADRDAAKGAPKKSLWGRLKHAVTGGGRKRSWMEMLFGARKPGAQNTAAAMGIRSTKAPYGQSSGWADQLIDASKRGDLGDDGIAGGAVSERLLSAPAKDAPAERSFEYFDPDEQPKQAPALLGKGAEPSPADRLDKLRTQQQFLYQAPEQEPAGDDLSEDDSINQEDEEDSPAQQARDAQMMQFYTQMFKKY